MKLGLNDEVEETERAPFPNQARSQFAVFNPNAGWRMLWDAGMLVLVIFVMFVTPFELAFVNNSKIWDGLWTTNRFVDLNFMMDMLFTFNTGFFDFRTNKWHVSRIRIASNYFRFWFWLDALSLVYWDAFPIPSAFAVLRLIRLVRLVKLIRVAKAPRIIERWNRYVTVSFKERLIIKYLLSLVVVLHLEACLIRMAHGIERGERRNRDTNSYLRWWIEERRGARFNGNWALYVDSLDWACKVMLGESAYRTTAEGVLSCTVNLIGVAFVAFLFGDLTNILCNLDPASNEFKQTVDNLNKFMSDKRFPPAARMQLREYLLHSETLFKNKFYTRLIDKLSPNLQELVAHLQLGHKVVRVAFFSYARQCILGIVVGRSLKIKQYASDPEDGSDVCVERRDATIIGLLGDMKYDVRYADGTVERSVVHARISVQDEEVALQRAVGAMESSTKLLVTQLAHAMEMAMFMAGDYIVRKRITLCNTMYLVDAGKVIAFGREVTVPFGLSVVEEGDSLGDKEIATLVAGHKVRPSWYNARSTRMTYCNVLKGSSFVEVINRPGFEAFLKYIIRYGAWYNFKLACINAVRTGELAAIASRKGPRRSSFDARAAAAMRRETERMEAHLDRAADKLEQRLEAQLGRFSAALDARFSAVERRLDALGAPR